MRIVLDLQGAQSESRFRGIGRYSLGLAQAIAREAARHEVWLALSGRFPDSIEPLRANFAELIPTEHIRVFELPGPVAEADPANAWRMQAAELLREKFLADLRPDIVHVSTMLEGWGNEVVVSAGRFNSKVTTATTLYDLIPLLRPETYLCNPAAKRSYLRHAQSLKRSDVLLAISESSRREAIQALQISPKRIVMIGAGIDLSFQESKPSRDAQATLMACYDLQRPFVLYTSAIEPRKNVEGLIAAFALLPEGVRLAHQLVIVGRVWEDDRRRLAALARKHGLNAGDMICLDHVPDEDLRLLYSICSVFVFPSLHEGFGLPVLEAMVCGAPVIGSNCTSIPEIINREDALFDPHRPQDIANRMAEVLTNAELRESLKTWGSERAKAFTWKASACKALEALEALHERRNVANAVTVAVATQRRPLLAFVSPLPPEQTGSADHAAKLLPNLARHYEIVCIVDQPEVTDPWITAEFPIRDVRWFEENVARFDRILYQFGNSPSHKHIFGLLEEHPGVVVLHDYFLGELLNWMANSGYAPGSFTKALYHSHGFSALKKDREEGREKSIELFPCNAEILRTSMAVIVHSDELTELTRTLYGAKVSAAIRQLPCLSHAQRDAERGQTNHPENIAALYWDSIEEAYTMSSQASEQKLVQAIARIPGRAMPSESDLASVAAALVTNRERSGLQQILVDVTNVAQQDAHTGIQRATRGLLMALIADPPAGYRIEPVRAAGEHYVYARCFASRCLGLSEGDLTDDLVEAGNGDIFLALEWGADVVPAMKPWFLEKRQHGMRIVFVVYDMLPVVRPEFFPPEIAPLASAWIGTVTDIADRVACISRTVADELHVWLAEAKPQRLRPLTLGFFHLGADLHGSLPSKGLPHNAPEVLAKLRSRLTFLVVGTIEPRKGHQQALAAMERLWADGVDANLALIGNQGWMMDDLVKRIKQHPELDHRLFWLQGVSDEMLEQIYGSSSALLATSEGEGFGLPLIEAAQCGLPIIARDIPVFREVAGEFAYYFCGEDAKALADALRTWLSLDGTAPASSSIRWQTWQESSRQLLAVVLGNHSYRSWPDPTTTLRSETISDHTK